MAFNKISVRTLILILVNILSVVACLCFLNHFRRLKSKLLSVKMIAVLCLSDLIFHTMFIITYLFQLESWSFIMFDVLLLIAFHFSLFWTCSITYLMYKLLSSAAIPCNQYYIISSTVILLFLSTSLSVA